MDMPLYYTDIWYFILVIPALIISLVAQSRVKSTYKKFSSVPNSRGITGAMAAQMVLSFYGISDVMIQPIAGSLTDNYNPSKKVISLSQGVYNSNSVAAIGIACHEAGHAAQHAENYLPNQIRTKLVPVCNIGSTIGLPIAIIGVILGLTNVIYLGLALYGLVFLFSLVTLPVEFNASMRAIRVIEDTGMLFGEEVDSAKKVLKTAAMTYVASMLTALANLLRFVIRFLGSSKRR